MKKYIAKTDVSINIVLPSGTNHHISFDSITGGGSVFYTDDEEVQKAIESHYKFGKLFRIDNTFVQTAVTHKKKFTQKATVNETPDVATDTDIDDTDTDTGNGDDASDDDGTGIKTITVTDIDAAKSYLAETFGISRTKLKSKTAIVAAAEANGIVFQGI